MSAIETRPFTSASADLTIEEAIKVLAEQSVACLLVEENDKLVGVFSDRDALNCVALEYEEKKHLRLRELMTADPVYVHESDSSAAALSVMAVMGHRHVPVLNSDGKIMGIVSPNRVSAFLLSFLDN